ncbi:RidA family protein [Tahibacter amnicola]|uniref:RidA family protein n=1 Tax=Tahibacter amnicola TaxID=2976241 RepID=A0ABY6BJM2_9GAMM|nr:RidA family protein [Tahibacter amnicola]UXI69969.1 RidA family protein [Tahibacter amnicola]
MSESIRTRLAALGHELPAVTPAAGNYVSTTRAGNLLFVAGQIPARDGTAVLCGKLGATIDEAQARQAAELCAVGVLAQLDAAIGGDWSKVARVVRIGGFINAVDTFDGHSRVMNGASDLLVAVLGERGRHARTSVGVASLPAGAVVEVDAVIELVAA